MFDDNLIQPLFPRPLCILSYRRFVNRLNLEDPKAKQLMVSTHIWQHGCATARRQAGRSRRHGE